LKTSYILLFRSVGFNEKHELLGFLFISLPLPFTIRIEKEKRCYTATNTLSCAAPLSFQSSGFRPSPFSRAAFAPLLLSRAPSNLSWVGLALFLFLLLVSHERARTADSASRSSLYDILKTNPLQLLSQFPSFKEDLIRLISGPCVFHSFLIPL